MPIFGILEVLKMYSIFLMKMNEGAKSFIDRRFDNFKYGGKNKEHCGRGGGLPIPAKCMVMMPERIALKMIDEQGWVLRQKIIWAKQILLNKEKRTTGSVMPTSVKDRFNMSWEYLYHFVKNKRYHFNLDAVRLPNQVVGVVDLRPNGILRQKLYPNSKYNQFNYRVRDARRKTGQPQFKASEEEIKKYEYARTDHRGPNNKTEKNYGFKKIKYFYNPDPRGNDKDGPGSFRTWKDRQRYQGKFLNHSEAEMFGSPRARTQRKRDKTLIDPNVKGLRQAPEPTEPNAFHPLGKNIPAVWQINPEPHNIGIELNSDYIEIAQKRIKQIAKQLL